MLKFSDLGILADDLTGACDVAACFAPGNGPVSVLLSPEHRAFYYGLQAVINTQSRLLLPEEARASLRVVGKQFSDRPVIFKKVDSALRGPAGAELEGLLEGTGDRKVVLAPAIPRIGKTVKNGIIYDSGVPIDQTPYAVDPASPVESSHIDRILRRTGAIHCEIPDAESEDDLRRIVEKSARNLPVVFAGSLGLADALAHLVEFRPWKSLVKPAERIVIVCGSLYQRARDQIQAAADHYGTDVITIDGTGSIPALNSRDKKSPVIIRLNDRIETELIPSRFVSRINGEISAVIRDLQPGGLGIIGGETAFHLLCALGTTRMDVYSRIGEVMTGGVLYDGFLAGGRFVTKGGSVGSTDAVIQMIHYLQGTKA